MPDTPQSGTAPSFRKPLERPSVRKKVQALILDGLNDTAISKVVGVTRPAIAQFRQRHAAELAAMTAEVERQIEDVAIAHQVNRIHEYQRLYDETDARRRAVADRAVMGYAALLREQRGILNDVATERDQLPRGTIANVQQNIILIRQVQASDDLIPLG